MPSLHITISNATGQEQVVHVFDTLQGGTRPVDGSPFSLAKGARSPSFAVRSDARGRGIVAFRCDSRVLATGIEVGDGASVDIR
jgi:hypothetical protein